MKVKSIRYFKTRRGLGYEAKTDKGSIWNDGSGGCTYFEPDDKTISSAEYTNLLKLTENELEHLIDIYEGVK